MKFYFSIFFIIALLSCKSKTNNTPTPSHQPNLDSSITNLNSIDKKRLSKAHFLKETFLVKLKNRIDKEDVLLMDFLQNYERMINQESLDLTKLKKSEVKALGYDLMTSEGDLYLTKNTSFISDKLKPHLNPTSLEFLKLYSKEIDEICCEDAGLNIDTKELVNRVIQWDNFSKESLSTAYHEIAESSYWFYLRLLFEGIDNTPAFDFEDDTFNQDRLILMKAINANTPSYRASKAFDEYLQILSDANYKKTTAVQDYLNQLLN